MLPVVVGISVALIALGYLIHLKIELRSMKERLDLVLSGRSTATVVSRSFDPSLVALNDSVNRLMILLDRTTVDYNRVNRELKQMIASVSHDFRTPLTSIIGYLDLLEDPDTDEATRARYTEIVKGRASALSELIDSFYELSVIESRDYVLHPEQIRVQDQLQEVLSVYYEELDERFPSVSIDIDETLPPILSDRRALDRIFSNLVKNALTYGSETFHVSLKPKGDGVSVTFRNGGADPTANPEKLFERTYRLEENRTTKNAGLGLSIVRTLTEKLNGTIRAEILESELVFHLTFPSGRVLRYA